MKKIASAADDWGQDNHSSYGTESLASLGHVLSTRSNCEQLVYDQLMKKVCSLFLPHIPVSTVWRNAATCRYTAVSAVYVPQPYNTMEKVSDVELRKAIGVKAKQQVNTMRGCCSEEA